MINLFRKILPRPVKSVIRAGRNIPPALQHTYIRQPNVISFAKRSIRRLPQNILFYPDHPCSTGFNYTIITICHHLGYSMINNPQKSHHRCFNWQDTTFGQVDDQLRSLCSQERVINSGCLDISKKHVDKVFGGVFGYKAMLDPTTFEGKLVEKSDLNGKHDGRVMVGPVTEIAAGRVYQKLVENIDDERFVVDMRVPIFRDTIPFVFLKYKPIEKRFGLSTKAGLTQIENICSREEIDGCQLFCRKIGLDYGELDMGRDIHDGRLYIFDANNTPTIHYVGYSSREKSMIIKWLCGAFEQVFS